MQGVSSQARCLDCSGVCYCNKWIKNLEMRPTNDYVSCWLDNPNYSNIVGTRKCWALLGEWFGCDEVRNWRYNRKHDRFDYAERMYAGLYLDFNDYQAQYVRKLWIQNCFETEPTCIKRFHIEFYSESKGWFFPKINKVEKFENI